mmetsp:Transcript_31520/g.41667  ORF Transcript_31520/g.41667 Transcript_31520/m.41667 type:complete len:369 (-) Transcript_31520:186-1292(-)
MLRFIPLCTFILLALLLDFSISFQSQTVICQSFKISPLYSSSKQWTNEIHNITESSAKSTAAQPTEQKGKKQNQKGPKSISDRLNKLNFGFEVIETGRVQIDPRNIRTRNEPPLPCSYNFKAEWGKQRQMQRSASAQASKDRTIVDTSLNIEIASQLIECSAKANSMCPSYISCPYYSFRCAQGHVWQALEGTPACDFCPECNSPSQRSHRTSATRDYKRWTLQDVQEIARERGGKVLSPLYEGTRVPMTFECSQGHVWEARLENVAHKGTWCPHCAKKEKRRLSIHDMHETAEFFDGKLLSTEYISVNNKLQWQCQRGHVFYQTPNNLRRPRSGGRRPAWCKECYKLDGPPRYFAKKRGTPKKVRTQ